MKINIKSSLLISLFLGTFFYLLSNKNKTITKHQGISAEMPSILIIDKKSIPLRAPKLLIAPPAKNKLGISSNWKSK